MDQTLPADSQTPATQDVTQDALQDDSAYASELWSRLGGSESTELPQDDADASEPPQDVPEAAEEPPKDHIVADSQALAKRLEALERHNLELQHRIKSDDGRVAALQRKAEDAQRLLAEAQAKQDASKTRLANIEEDYPDIAEAIKAELQELSAAHQRQVDALKAQVDNFQHQLEPVQRMSEKNAQDELDEAVELKVPGWRQDVRTDEFRAYIDSQPEEMKVLALTSKNPGTAAWFVSQFRESKKKDMPSKRDRLERSAVPDARSSQISNASDDAYAQDLWKRLHKGES
jgi:hypothetical protein